MTPDDPKHGTEKQTLRDVVRGCPCQRCERGRVNSRRKYKLRQMGYGYYRPVEPSADRVDALLAAGWRLVDIEKRTGLGAATITDVSTRRTHRVSINTERAILAVDPTSEWLPRLTVPAIGTIRRFQALVVMGYTSREVSTRAGLTSHFGSALISLHPENVDRTTHDAVAAVYRELCGKVPNPTPQRRSARAKALKRGWVSPMGWENIDNPNEVPWLGASKQAKHPTRRERIAEIEQWISYGGTITDVCYSLGLDRDSLWKWCRQHGLLDLYDKLSAPTRRTSNQYARRGAA